MSSVFYLFQAIKAATDKESELPHLSGMAVVTLEGSLLIDMFKCPKFNMANILLDFLWTCHRVVSSLSLFFSRNGCQLVDYQLSLQRHVKGDVGKQFIKVYYIYM